MAGRLPESYIAPAHLLDLRARVRLRHSLVDQRGEWQQRIHAVLFHHGHPQKDGLLRGANRAWLGQIALPDAAREQVSVALAMIDALDAQAAPSPPSCAATRAANRAARRCCVFTASASSPRSRLLPSSVTRAGSLRADRRSATPAWTSRSISPTSAARPGTCHAKDRPRCAGRSTKLPRPRAGPAARIALTTTRPPNGWAATAPASPWRASCSSAASTSCATSATRRSRRPDRLGGRCARSPLSHRCPAAGSPHAAAATPEWTASKDRAAAPHHAGTPHQPSRHRPRDLGRGPR
jgi:hypothetical protein